MPARFRATVSPPVLAFFLSIHYLTFLSVVPDASAEYTSETAPLPPDLETEADELEFSPETNILRGRRNVVIRYGDVTITADEVTLNTKTQELSAIRGVRFTRGDFIWEGDSVYGKLRARLFELGRYKSVAPPWYVTGTGLVSDQAGRYEGGDVNLSTCSYLPEDHPHWVVSAKHIAYRSDGRFRAREVIFKIAGIPVFYLPVLFGDLDSDMGDFEFSAGYRDNYGATIRIGKKWIVNDTLSAKTDVIYRGKRGIAVDGRAMLSSPHHESAVRAYVIDDHDPPHDLRINDKEYSGRFEVEEGRYRIQTVHRSQPNPSLSLRLNADYISDYDLTQEFFKEEYRRDPQPVSVVDLTYHKGSSNLSLNYRPRLNDFESVVERTPEIRFSVSRIKVFQTALFFQNHSSAARYHMNWRDYDLPRFGNPLEPRDYGATRIDSLNILYYPFKIADLSLMPRAAARATYFSESSKRDITDRQLDDIIRIDDVKSSPRNTGTVQHYDRDGGKQLRLALEIGMEISAKRYRSWPELRSARWNLNGLRHLFKPYASYTYIPDPNVDRESLYFFDAIDRIDQSHFVRFGMQHDIQTRRGGRTIDICRIEQYLDYYISPENDADRSGDLGSLIEFRPTDRFRLWSNCLVESATGRLNLAYSGVTVRKWERVTINIGHLYRNRFVARVNEPMGTELTRIFTPGFIPVSYDRLQNLHSLIDFPIGDKYQFRAEYLIDLEDDRVGRQRYSIARDLHCWTGLLQVEHDESDWSVFLVFYLKAFPKLKLDVGG